MGIKRFVFFFILILLLVGVVLGRSKGNSDGKVVAPLPSPSNSLALSTEMPRPIAVLLNGRELEVYYQEIKGSLSLIPNFADKESSEKVFLDNNCKYGANGGFYTKEGGPLGLFAANGKIIGEELKSSTFNGFFWGKGGNFWLELTVPRDLENVDFALQSGPLFDVGYSGKGSFLEEDQKRRVMVVDDNSGKFYFVAIIEKGNNFGGPKLSEIAEVLRASKIANFNRALNLDGGSASAFYGENGEKFWEIVNVGSFFCGK